MRCIDFDKEFERYMMAYIREHGKEYRNYDALEEAVPQIYEEFLNTPVAWLGGAKPGEYFTQFDKPQQLINWMEDYFKQRIPVPDMLMNRIAELGAAAEEALLRLMHKERAPQEAKMTAITLLKEIDSLAPMEEFIEWQVTREEGENELADSALDSLASMGRAAIEPMRAALPRATQEGQEAMLTLLCDVPGDETVFQIAMALFEARKDRAAVLADCLGRLNDPRALPALIARAASQETSYLDYIELRNAIEMLGGDAPEREFDAEDPDYEALRSMQ